MKILATDTNYNKKNTNFTSMLVKSQDIPRLKEALPDVVSLSSELMTARFLSKFGDKIVTVIEGVLGVPLQKAFPKLSDMDFQVINPQAIVKDIFLKPNEKKKLAKAIANAEHEIIIAKEETMRRQEIFDKYWQNPKTACGKLKKLIDNLLKANPVRSVEINALAGDIKHCQQESQRRVNQARKSFFVENGQLPQ